MPPPQCRSPKRRWPVSRGWISPSIRRRSTHVSRSARRSSRSGSGPARRPSSRPPVRPPRASSSPATTGSPARAPPSTLFPLYLRQVFVLEVPLPEAILRVLARVGTHAPSLLPDVEQIFAVAKELARGADAGLQAVGLQSIRIRVPAGGRIVVEDDVHGRRHALEDRPVVLVGPCLDFGLH